jgi:hypothetical protein
MWLRNKPRHRGGKRQGRLTHPPTVFRVANCNTRPDPYLQVELKYGHLANREGSQNATLSENLVFILTEIFLTGNGYLRDKSDEVATEPELEVMVQWATGVRGTECSHAG